MIAVGQDGLVVNVMKYLDGQPLIGINPIRDVGTGVAPFQAGQLLLRLLPVLDGNYDVREITMARADKRRPVYAGGE